MADDLKTANTPIRGRLITGIALIAVGGASFVLSLKAATPETRVVGNNSPVNAEATDPFAISAYNSPTIVANPKNQASLVVASRVDLPEFNCAVQFSANGGREWARSELPLGDLLPGEAPSVACFAPQIAFSKNGVVHLAYTSFSAIENRSVPTAVWFTTSKDGGKKFEKPVRIAMKNAFQMRLAADPSRAGRVYLAWVQADETVPWGVGGRRWPITVMRSDDAGQSWRKQVRVTPSGTERAVAPNITVAENGAIYVAYLDVQEDTLDYNGGHEGKGGEPYKGKWSLNLAKSSGAGSKWTNSPMEEITPTQRFLMIFPPSPSLATEGESVWAAFHDARHGDADVFVWKSQDGGTNFDDPVRVNDTKEGDKTSQYLPELAISPEGRLDTVYYDRRGNKADSLNEVSLQSSFDGGRTFTPREALSDRNFDSRIGYGSEREMPDLGDRLGLLSTKTGALAVWADTRGGTSRTDRQDLAQAVVAFSRPSALQRVPAILAGMVALAGAVLLVGALRSGRR